MQLFLALTSLFLLGCSPKDGVVFHAFSKDGGLEYMFIHRGGDAYQGLVRYAGESGFRPNIVLPTNEFELAIDRAPGFVQSKRLITEPVEEHTSFRIVDEGVYVRRPGQTGLMSLVSMNEARQDSVLGPRLALFDETG